MSYLARLLPLILAFASISGPVVTLRPGDSASDSIMGDVEDPTAFATTYTSPLAWDDGGVVIKGRAWGESRRSGPRRPRRSVWSSAAPTSTCPTD